MFSGYMNALVEVVKRTFETMFQIELNVSECKQDSDLYSPFEISGAVGITGAMQGVVVVSFPKEFARNLVRLLGDAREDIPDEEIYDCVGEIANIIAGNLLPSLKRKNSNAHQLSLPLVVVGKHQVVWRRKDMPYDLIFLETNLGTFCAGVNLREPNSAC
ncbi:MAG: chemotaxis protein CheX [Planctomycetota bacterium]